MKYSRTIQAILAGGLILAACSSNKGNDPAASGVALASEKAGPSVKTRARTSAQSTLATTVSTAAKSAGMSAVKDLCPSCGQPVRTGAAYCKNCGQKLS